MYKADEMQLASKQKCIYKWYNGIGGAVVIINRDYILCIYKHTQWIIDEIYCGAKVAL